MIWHGATGFSGTITAALENLTRPVCLQVRRMYKYVILVSFFALFYLAFTFSDSELKLLYLSCPSFFVFLYIFLLCDVDDVRCEYTVQLLWPAECTVSLGRVLSWIQDFSRYRAVWCDSFERWCEHDWRCSEQFDLHIALGAWSRRWAHWGGSSAVLQKDGTPYVDKLFIRCEEEYDYTSRLAVVIAQCHSLSVHDLLTTGLYYNCWVQPYE